MADTTLQRKIEASLGGSYEMLDGRKFWIDTPVAVEMSRRVIAVLEEKAARPVLDEDKKKDLELPEASSDNVNAVLQETLKELEEMYHTLLDQSDREKNACKKLDDTHGMNFYQGERSGLIAFDIAMTPLKKIIRSVPAAGLPTRVATAPAFDKTEEQVEYVWWSWNQYYPYWSRSCWKGKTEQEAFDELRKPLAVGMRNYANALVRESKRFEVVVTSVVLGDSYDASRVSSSESSSAPAAPPVIEEQKTDLG